MKELFSSTFLLLCGLKMPHLHLLENRDHGLKVHYLVNRKGEGDNVFLRFLSFRYNILQQK